TLANGTQVNSNAGLFALASNSGSHHAVRFAEVPEANINLKAPILDHLTLSLGLSALYWSHIVRPATQVDRNLAITQIPNFPPGAAATPTGLGLPSVPFNQSDLLLLGVNIGLEVNW